MQVNRGDVHSPDRYAQLRDYSGLRFGNITPTDIDGLIEYKNLAYVILELKFGDKSLEHGQELALERLHDDLRQSHKLVLTIIANHNTPIGQKIDAAKAIVVRFRYFRTWETPPTATIASRITVKELVSRFLSFTDNNNKKKRSSSSEHQAEVMARALKMAEDNQNSKDSLNGD